MNITQGRTMAADRLALKVIRANPGLTAVGLRDRFLPVWRDAHPESRVQDDMMALRFRESLERLRAKGRVTRSAEGVWKANGKED